MEPRYSQPATLNQLQLSEAYYAWHFNSIQLTVREDCAVCQRLL